jgi:hypothetical protein
MGYCEEQDGVERGGGVRLTPQPIQAARSRQRQLALIHRVKEKCANRGWRIRRHGFFNPSCFSFNYRNSKLDGGWLTCLK